MIIKRHIIARNLFTQFIDSSMTYNVYIYMKFFCNLFRKKNKIDFEILYKTF